jgi:hypothetical protein
MSVRHVLTATAAALLGVAVLATPASARALGQSTAVDT